jgi:hypothetical protein
MNWKWVSGIVWEEDMADKNVLFRTDIARSKEVRVDRKQDIISAFAVVTKGVTHDERGEFDDIALDNVVELGNKAKLGVKSRFGHPNMSSTALGTFLGRVRNFRRDGDIVRADLHIDKTAHDTPDGDLATYVMNLAESDPNAFGASMVIYWDEEVRQEKDKDGNQPPPFIRVKKLSSVDVVDDPAANNGLFGMPFFSGSVRPSAEMTHFLDRFLEESDAVEKVISFFERYRVNRQEIEKTTQKKEGKDMFEDLTVEKLKAERKDLYDSVHSTGSEEGLKKGTEEGQKLERERVLSILKEAKNFKDMGDLAFEAIEKGLTLDKALISFQKKQLEGLKGASPENPGPDADTDGKGKKSHLDKAREYQKEHNCSMTQALQATAEKRKG